MSRLAGLMLAFASILLLSKAAAQGPVASKHDAAALHASLREVINTGADLFNLHADYAGCYRLYQGSLIAIKPMLTPELRTGIDTALADAAKLPNSADRAHRLRTAIDAVREQLRHASPPIPAPPALKAPTSRQTEGELIRVPPTKVN